jgi:hypothetical protein
LLLPVSSTDSCCEVLRFLDLLATDEVCGWAEVVAVGLFVVVVVVVVVVVIMAAADVNGVAAVVLIEKEEGAEEG